MNRNKISVFLILIGLIILIYPVYKGVHNNYEQKKIIKEWEETFRLIGEEDKNKEKEQEVVIEDQTEIEEPETAKTPQKNIMDYDREGILTIKKINLKLPILIDTTVKNLDVSVASINKTGPAGVIGNYAIAGHRSRIYGQLLNRLNEVEEGDIITVETKEDLFNYTVTEILYVQPEDVWVLNKKEEKKEITLITCDPIRNPTQRLIVKGEILDIN